MKTVMTPIALHIFLRDPLDKRVIIGGIVGITGIAVLLYPSLHFAASELSGLALAFIGTAITAIGDVASARNARKGIDPVSANCLGFLFAAIFMVIVCVLQGRSFDMPTSATYLAALLYLTVAASFFAWLFYLQLVSRIGAAKSSFMVAVFPAIGGIASVLLGELKLTVFLIFGCLLSCLGAAYALGLFSANNFWRLVKRKIKKSSI